MRISEIGGRSEIASDARLMLKQGYGVEDIAVAFKKKGVTVDDVRGYVALLRRTGRLAGLWS